MLNVECETHSSDNETVVVAVFDTLREVTTITVQTNEAGDTLRVERITDRSHGAIKVQSLELRVERQLKVDSCKYVVDSVVDSIVVSTKPPSMNQAQPKGAKANAFKSILIWLFLVLIAATLLVLIIKKRW